MVATGYSVEHRLYQEDKRCALFNRLIAVQRLINGGHI